MQKTFEIKSPLEKNHVKIAAAVINFAHGIKGYEGSDKGGENVNKIAKLADAVP